MKKRPFYIIAPIVLSATVIMGSAFSLKSQANSAAQPGSADDPVVTKSYVDEQIRNMGGDSGGGQAASIIVVTLTKGQTLVANSGAEFILRVGQATAMSIDGNGIPDVTLGKDIVKGAQISKNSLLIFPGAGRGITVQSDKAIVMVRGGYTVQ
ncbi:MAG: hypothetical protein H7X86_10170 [Gorillibacterium sp.]|nr:hypothetical protein [Gorillibacterium sp.]